MKDGETIKANISITWNEKVPGYHIICLDCEKFVWIFWDSYEDPLSLFIKWLEEHKKECGK